MTDYRDDEDATFSLNLIEGLCEIAYDVYDKAGWKRAPNASWADAPEDQRVTMRAAILTMLLDLKTKNTMSNAPRCRYCYADRLSWVDGRAAVHWIVPTDKKPCPGTAQLSADTPCCEANGCSDVAVSIAHDDEHDLRPWAACKKHYAQIHGQLPRPLRPQDAGSPHDQPG